MNLEEPNVTAIYHDGREESFKYLYRTQNRDIVMIHGALHIAADYLHAVRSIREVFFIINFAWYFDRNCRAAVVRELARMESVRPRSSERLLFLLNSNEEKILFDSAFPDIKSIVVSNNFALSENIFDLKSPDNTYDYVYTARPLKFKNHYLAPRIENSILISDSPVYYKNDTEFVDVPAFLPGKIVMHLSPDQVASVLNESCCGLILSMVEGACYASTEYLLCGIPVVSTKAFGGRDAYYDEDNCLLVPPEKDEIFEAVKEVSGRMRAGDICRDKIRRNCLAVQKTFREVFAAALSEFTGMSVRDQYDDIVGLVLDDSKLKSRVNYWTASIAVA